MVEDERQSKPTLVVHSRRTDEADGDGNFGARAARLRSECSARACKGTNDAARKGAGAATEVTRGRITGARGCTSVQNAKRKSKLCDRNGNGQGGQGPGDRCGSRHSRPGAERWHVGRKAPDERGRTQTGDHGAAAGNASEANADAGGSRGGEQDEGGRIPGGKFKE